MTNKDNETSTGWTLFVRNPGNGNPATVERIAPAPEIPISTDVRIEKLEKENADLRHALLTARCALMHPNNGWKGNVERAALDEIREVLGRQMVEQ